MGAAIVNTILMPYPQPNDAASGLPETRDPMEQLKEAFAADNPTRVRQLLQRYPVLKSRINEPAAAFDAPLIVTVRSREMLDVFLEAGADINARSRWWAGGFGLLDSAEPALAQYAIQRGAIVDAHAAARLDMTEKLRELILSEPSLVHARGGDGQTPLHFAGTIDVAQLLLDHGAHIDARDIDHESTPAQYMVHERQDVCRCLVQRGCGTDILMAAALGDADLAAKHLDADPDCVRIRVNDEHFPKQNPRSGGMIYHWTLGSNVSPHDVAKQFGRENVFQLLMDRSPTDVKLLAACWTADETAVKTLLAEHPGVVAALSETHHRQVAHAAQNNNLAAVRVMLAAGLPADGGGQHGATPLHWAAFHGNAEMAKAILRHNPPLEATDADFHATPLGWATYGSEHGCNRQMGNHTATVEVLLEAGAEPPEKIEGSEAVRKVLGRRSPNS